MKNTKRINLLSDVFEGLWFYTLLVWVYIAIENLVYPATVFNSVLSVYFPVKQNLLAISSFVLSFIFFVVWRYLKSSSQR